METTRDYTEYLGRYVHLFLTEQGAEAYNSGFSEATGILTRVGPASVVLDRNRSFPARVVEDLEGG
jgi:hypothetical protein